LAAPGLPWSVAEAFSLLDEVYYDALRRVTEVLEREGVPFCLVGGGASQAWIASLRTAGGRQRLSDEPLLTRALRRTRDLDFATRAEPARMLRVLNHLAASAGEGAHVLGPRAIRLGPVSVSFTLSPGDLSGMEELYDELLDSRTPLSLRRGPESDEVPTIGLEELLATKLTRRGDKAKNIVDVTQLLAASRDAGRIIVVATVRRLVGGRPDARALLAGLEQELSEEEVD
jgi:hypothetical protein